MRPDRLRCSQHLFAIAILAATTVTGRGAPTLIQLGSNAHGLTGFSTANLSAGGLQAALTAGPVGAVFDESHGAGLGVDSRGVAGAIDVGSAYGPSKINIIGGQGPAAGQSEWVKFSFDRGGVLRDLLFDGVKDETLEYFQLTLPNGDTLSLFDFETPFRLTQQGFGLADLSAPNAMFLGDAADDLRGVNIPFQAGDVFTLTYGEAPFPPGYVPLQNDAGNGARWQGMVIVPEPSGAAWAAVAWATACALLLRMPRQAAFSHGDLRTARCAGE